MAEKYDNDFSLELPLLVSKFKVIEKTLCLEVDGKDTDFDIVYSLLSFLDACINQLEVISKGLYGLKESTDTAKQAA